MTDQVASIYIDAAEIFPRVFMEYASSLRSVLETSTHPKISSLTRRPGVSFSDKLALRVRLTDDSEEARGNQITLSRQDMSHDQWNMIKAQAGRLFREYEEDRSYVLDDCDILSFTVVQAMLIRGHDLVEYLR
jgi:hypothetical protein